MRALEFITGHVIYNPAYTYKFQLKTTILATTPSLIMVTKQLDLRVIRIRMRRILWESPAGQGVHPMGKHILATNLDRLRCMLIMLENIIVTGNP